MSNETKILTGIGIVTVILIGIAVFSLGGKNDTGNKTAETALNKEVLIRPDSHKIGSTSAKVTLVEFGDFQCPACGNAHPVVQQLVGEYEGKMQFVFRNYPLPVHKNAMIAAQAAEAAGAQGKFFEMHDLLFEYQKEWSETGDPLKEHFVEYAKQIGIDAEKFEKEVREGKYKAKIEKDISDGNAAGVNATPTFYINGVKQEGGAPYSEFKQTIDEALQKAS